MEKIRLGIDLGTTNTVICYMKKNKPNIVKLKGSGMLPSVLYVEDDNTITVGRDAVDKSTINPVDGISSSKTYMGDRNKVWEIKGHKFTPTDVATEILKAVKAQTIKKLKLPDDVEVEAIITVPAYFTANQSDETKVAGSNAGIKVLGIRPEPSAAAIANIKESELENEKIFIVDLGGGTFDVCILQSNSSQAYETIAVGGDRKLGGDDFDDRVFDFIKEYVEDDLGIDLSSVENSELGYSDYWRMVGSMKSAAIEAKKELSDQDETEISLLKLFPYNGDYYSLQLTLTRDKFHTLCDDLFNRVIEKIHNIFDDKMVKFTKDDIDSIILAGGSCYIPRIKDDVEKFFGKSTVGDIDRSTMVAIGACFIAESWDDLSEQVSNDIISHSLGIKLLSDNKVVLSKMLFAGQKYPCSFEKQFTTSIDNQTEVEIAVFEAGSDMEDVLDIFSSKNEYIHDLYGSFVLEGIEPAPKGEARITVTFDYDKSRSLIVTALDEKTNISKKVKIQKGIESTSSSSTKNVSQVNFMVLIDTSGSMRGAAIKDACNATKVLVTDIIDLSTHKIGIVGFGDSATLISELSSNQSQLISSISRLNANGGTNMYDGIATGVNELKKVSSKKVIILITDGAPDSRKKTLDAKIYAEDNDIDIIAIGAGHSVSKDFLSELVSEEKYLFSISNMNELSTMFEKVVNMYLSSL